MPSASSRALERRDAAEVVGPQPDPGDVGAPGSDHAALRVAGANVSRASPISMRRPFEAP